MELMSLPAIFYDAISVAIPQIVDLLKDEDRAVRVYAQRTIGTLAKHCM